MTRAGSHIEIRPIAAIKPPHAEKFFSNRGIPLYVVRGGSEPVLHLDLVFTAGKGHEKSRAAAHATAALFSEGTQEHPSQYIAEQLEYYGATLRATANADLLSISLYCMTKVFAPVLDIIFDLLSNAAFPSEELAIYQQNRSQKIKIALEQNETLANRQLSRNLFGDHPYGDTTTVEDVMRIERDHLLEHFAFIGSANLKVFLGGSVKEQEINTLFERLDQMKAGLRSDTFGRPQPQPPLRSILPGPQKYQSAIRMGRQIVNRSHDDFAGLYVLNAILGGFFGSRLMKNIREEKGLTYSIYSSLETLVNGACLILTTEADAKNTQRVEDEIMHEIGRLHQEQVLPEELAMVKNYLMGNFMMQLDGPFRKMDTVKMMTYENLNSEDFERFIDGINCASPQSIQAMAHKYLSPEELHVAIVG